MEATSWIVTGLGAFIVLMVGIIIYSLCIIVQSRRIIREAESRKARFSRCP